MLSCCLAPLVKQSVSNPRTLGGSRVSDPICYSGGGYVLFRATCLIVYVSLKTELEQSSEQEQERNMCQCDLNAEGFHMVMDQFTRLPNLRKTSSEHNSKVVHSKPDYKKPFGSTTPLASAHCTVKILEHVHLTLISCCCPMSTHMCCVLVCFGNFTGELNLHFTVHCAPCMCARQFDSSNNTWVVGNHCAMPLSILTMFEGMADTTDLYALKRFAAIPVFDVSSTLEGCPQNIFDECSRIMKVCMKQNAFSKSSSSVAVRESLAREFLERMSYLQPHRSEKEESEPHNFQLSEVFVPRLQTKSRSLGCFNLPGLQT